MFLPSLTTSWKQTEQDFIKEDPLQNKGVVQQRHTFLTWSVFSTGYFTELHADPISLLATATGFSNKLKMIYSRAQQAEPDFPGPKCTFAIPPAVGQRGPSQTNTAIHAPVDKYGKAKFRERILVLPNLIIDKIVIS